MNTISTEDSLFDLNHTKINIKSIDIKKALDCINHKIILKK